jgi:hypothetical protein
VADFNRDGYLDVAVESDGEILILLGNGDGTLVSAGTVTGSAGAPFLAGNFGGPSGVDLLVFDTFNTLTTFYGNGDGTFTKQASTSVPTTNFLTAITTGDFFGAGRPGVAIANSNQLLILEPKAGGTFKTVTTIPIRSSGQWSMVSGDFNGDGKVDLALFSNQLTLLLGDGKGGFTAGTIATAPYSKQLAFADFNGDGRLDLVTGGEGLSALLQPSFEVSTGHLSFVSKTGGPTNPQSVQVTNTGASALGITKISLSGKHAGEFSSGFSNNCGTSLAPGASCQISITYTPAKTSEHVTATLVLNDGDGKQEIGLDGRSE